MLSKSIRSILAAIALFALAVPSWGYMEPFIINPENYGLPKRMRGLTDFQLLYKNRKQRTSLEESKIVLTWMAEERKAPSPTTRGVGGGDITSGYIQAQMMIHLGYDASPLFMQKLADNSDIDPAMRDAARIILGLMGDAKQESALISILEKHSEPYFRAMSARALGVFGSINALPALKAALDDPYSVHAGRSCVRVPGTSDESITYPVREAAKESIRNIENPQVMAILINRSKANFERLADIAIKETPCE